MFRAGNGFRLLGITRIGGRGSHGTNGQRKNDEEVEIRFSVLMAVGLEIEGDCEFFLAEQKFGMGPPWGYTPRRGINAIPSGSLIFPSACLSVPSKKESLTAHAGRI